MKTEQLITFLISPGADNRRSNAEDRCECEGDSFYYQLQIEN